MTRLLKFVTIRVIRVFISAFPRRVFGSPAARAASPKRQQQAATLPIEFKRPASASAFALSFYVFSKAPRNFFGIESDWGV